MQVQVLFPARSAPNESSFGALLCHGYCRLASLALLYRKYFFPLALSSRGQSQYNVIKNPKASLPPRNSRPSAAPDTQRSGRPAIRGTAIWLDYRYLSGCLPVTAAPYSISRTGKRFPCLAVTFAHRMDGGSIPGHLSESWRSCRRFRCGSLRCSIAARRHRARRRPG